MRKQTKRKVKYKDRITVPLPIQDKPFLEWMFTPGWGTFALIMGIATIMFLGLVIETSFDKPHFTAYKEECQNTSVYNYTCMNTSTSQVCGNVAYFPNGFNESGYLLLINQTVCQNVPVDEITQDTMCNHWATWNSPCDEYYTYDIEPVKVKELTAEWLNFNCIPPDFNDTPDTEHTHLDSSKFKCGDVMVVKA